MNEKLIEKKLREATKAAGGLAIKLFSPYYTGLPDRMLLLPGGRLIFAELKTTGKKPTKRQERVHKDLRTLGFTVEVVSNERELDELIRIL